jgi:signal transduction histidine kinase
MRRRLSLRHRIIVSFLVLGTVLTALYAVSLLATRHYLERQLIGQTLQSDLRRKLDAVREEPSQEQLYSDVVQAWLTGPGRLEFIPRELHELETGVHEVSTESGDFIAVVQRDDDLWGYLVYDVSVGSLNLRSMALVVMISLLVFSLLAFLLAWWSAARVMKPVLDLASRVRSMDDEHDAHEALSPHFTGDEVGELACALDDYAERLTALVERDKEFNADVSHELRTPLAVIKGASELLIHQPDLPAKAVERVQRIARAAQQSADLTTALLHLVRDPESHPADIKRIQVDQLVEQVIDQQRVHLANKPVKVRFRPLASPVVEGSEPAFSVAIGNLIGNAFKYTPQGMVTVTVDDKAVIVEDTGPGIPHEEINQVFTRHYRGSSASGNGSGLGLAIVQRLCNLFAWDVSIKAGAHGGVVARLDFSGQRRPLENEAKNRDS